MWLVVIRKQKHRRFKFELRREVPFCFHSGSQKCLGTHVRLYFETRNLASPTAHRGYSILNDKPKSQKNSHTHILSWALCLYTFFVKCSGICKHSLIALKMLLTSCSSPFSWLGLAFALVGMEFPYTDFEVRPSTNETFTELVPTSIPKINSAKSITRPRVVEPVGSRYKEIARALGRQVRVQLIINYCCGRLDTLYRLYQIRR